MSGEPERVERTGPRGDEDRFLALLMRLAVDFINAPLAGLDDAINAALGEAAAFVGADRGYVFLHDWTAETTSNSHEWCAHGIEPMIDILQGVPMELFPAWMAAHLQGGPFQIASVDDLPESDEGVREVLLEQGIQSLITLPLQAEGGLLGFVGFDAVRQQRDWADRERDLLAVLAELLANAETRRQRESELERARHAAAEAQRRLELALRVESDLVWEHDVLTGRTHYPPAFYRVLGWSTPGPEVAGTELVESFMEPEELDRLRQAVASAIEAGEGFFEVELEFRRPDRTRVPAAVAGGISRDELGRVVRIAGTARDLTVELQARRTQERREQIEAMLARVSRRFVEAVPVEETLAVALQEIGRTFGAAHAAVLRRDEVSGAWAAVSTWAAPDAAGKGFGVPGTDEELRQVLARLERGETVLVADSRDATTDRGLKRLLARQSLRTVGYLPVAVKGRLEAVLALGATTVSPCDPTELALLRAAAEMAASALARDRAQSDLVQAREEADAANAAKTRFLSTISHEIRTPLNGILGLAELLGDTVHEERAQQYVRSMRAAASSLRTLLDDVLDIARIESGRLTLEDRPTDVPALVDDVVRLYRHQADSRGVRLAVAEGPACLPVLLDGDRLRQVLVNLVGNALKFTAPGGEVAIRMACIRSDRPDHVTLHLQVVDTGSGMTPEDVERVFEPFVQLEPRLGDKAPGTGLGLPIVRQILDAMGGEICIDSERGVGTMVAVAVEAATATMPDAVAEVPVEVVLPPSVRVVVAEDNSINQEVLLAFLEELGVRNPVTVTDGRQAVRHIREHGADLVLMDNFMPVMDGLTATRLLREHGADVRVVIVTADVSSDALARCQAAGADAVLAKPFDRGQLRVVLARVLRDVASSEPAAPVTGAIGEPHLWTLPTVDGAVVDALAARPRGRTTMLVRLLELFDAQVPGLLADLRGAATAGDLDGLRRASHTLVSAVATVGLRRAAEVAARTQRAAAALLQAPSAGRGPDAAELTAWAELVVSEVEQGRRELGARVATAGGVSPRPSAPDPALPSPRAARRAEQLRP